MRLIVIESPWAGDTMTHAFYARRCVKDSLQRGESPIASHLLYTQAAILDDDDPEERKLGMCAGWAWYRAADAVVLYVDYGVSRGMQAGLDMAALEGKIIERREIGKLG